MLSVSQAAKINWLLSFSEKRYFNIWVVCKSDLTILFFISVCSGRSYYATIKAPVFSSFHVECRNVNNEPKFVFFLLHLN